MPTAKKLPSGSYRVRVYAYTDNQNQRHYKSFTASTKKEAELMALSFTNSMESPKKTFKQALEGYIASRESVIAVDTLKEYKRSARKDFDSLLDKDINEITQEDIQLLVNEHAKTKAPKTINNIHGLLSAVFKLYRPDFKLTTTLPQKVINHPYIPTDEDIKTILAYAKEKDYEMYKAILLAAFGPLRRSEICALESSDFVNNQISIRGAIVTSEQGWKKKQTKSDAGDRLVPLPDFVYNELKHIDGKIIELKPNMISDRFIDIVVRCGLKHFTFHSLRHYCA